MAMSERLTPEQEKEIRERLHQNGSSYDLLTSATADIRALLTEIDTLRKEREGTQVDTARAIELLEPLTRWQKDMPPMALRVQVEHALRFLHPPENEKGLKVDT